MAKTDYTLEDLMNFHKERNLSIAQLNVLFNGDCFTERRIISSMKWDPEFTIENILEIDSNSDLFQSMQVTKIMLTRNVNGQYLYDLRIHLGITQKEMAASIGYSKEQFRHAEEKREKTLSRKMRNKLVDIYPDQIISDEWNTQLSDYDHLGINNFFADYYSQFPQEIDLIHKSLRNLLSIDNIKDSEKLLGEYMEFLGKNLSKLNADSKTIRMGNHK